MKWHKITLEFKNMYNAIIPYTPECPTMWGLWWRQVTCYSCTNSLD